MHSASVGSSWDAEKRIMDLETHSTWLNAIWRQFSHLQNGTINTDSERQGSREREIGKSGLIITSGSWGNAWSPLSGQPNKLLVSLLLRRYSGHTQKLKI